MTDPVFTADGESYERAAIERWLAGHNTSPATGAALTHMKLTSNVALRKAIIEWRERQAVAKSNEEAAAAVPVAAAPADCGATSKLTSIGFEDEIDWGAVDFTELDAPTVPAALTVTVTCADGAADAGLWGDIDEAALAALCP